MPGNNGIMVMVNQLIAVTNQHEERIRELTEKLIESEKKIIDLEKKLEVLEMKLATIEALNYFKKPLETKVKSNKLDFIWKNIQIYAPFMLAIPFVILILKKK
jgi:hypothetical protein